MASSAAATHASFRPDTSESPRAAKENSLHRRRAPRIMAKVKNPHKAIVLDLFQAHARKVSSYLGHRLRNDEDGRDAAQEVFLKLWRQETNGNLRAEAVGYMHVAANSVATDAERWRAHHAPELQGDEDLESAPARTASLEDQAHWRKAMAVLVASVKELPTTHRQIFVLHFLKGLRYPEISARMGIAERSIERYMAAALAQLHEKLEEYL